MKSSHRFIGYGSGLLLAVWVMVGAAFAADAAKIRVLLITGGHDYDKAQFHQMFADLKDLEVRHVEHANTAGAPDPVLAWFRPEAAGKYDVIVLYDMWQDMAEEGKANFVKLLRAGKGLVATHHCLCSYQKWDEYGRIVGGKYHLDKHTENGVEKPASTYQHDVDFRVHVEDPGHPITRGVSDFTIHDETYGGFSVNPDVTPLLTTTEPTSTKTLCWAHHYGKSRVVYLELGHDRVAYANPSYVKLLSQSIAWAALPAKP